MGTAKVNQKMPENTQFLLWYWVATGRFGDFFPNHGDFLNAKEFWKIETC